MPRPKVDDDSKCFICQDAVPTCEAIRNKESFKLCDQCARILFVENNARNMIRESLYRSDVHRIFTMALGWDLTPVRIDFKPLEETKSEETK